MGPEGFIYPNEAEIQWSVLIVLYPYITGLVAGSFIVSALYHVFGLKGLKPVARLSLLTALAFLLVAPMALQAHLGRPERAFEIFWTPNYRSAMAGFGYIWLFYTILVILETWLVFRADIVKGALNSKGPKRMVYRVLTLGSLDASEAALKFDEKATKVLATIGIPTAFLLHGYVGFIFGAIKANPWWSTPLMPVIFIMSAIVSGIALLTMVYIVTSAIKRIPIDQECLRNLGLWLLGFLLIDLALTGLELLSMAYEKEESWSIISQLISNRLAVSYLGIQLYFGALLPGFVLAITALIRYSDRISTLLRSLAAVMVLVGVFAMRWNVVIGGQQFSKSLRGFNSYSPPLFGQEGLATAVAIALVPFVIFAVVTYLLPPWEAATETSAEGSGGSDAAIAMRRR